MCNLYQHDLPSKLSKKISSKAFTHSHLNKEANRLYIKDIESRSKSATGSKNFGTNSGATNTYSKFV